MANEPKRTPTQWAHEFAWQAINRASTNAFYGFFENMPEKKYEAIERALDKIIQRHFEKGNPD